MISNKEEFNEIARLTFFADIGKEISSATTVDEVVNSVMKKIGEIFIPYNWSLLLKDRRTGELYFKLVIGECADNLKGQRIPKGKGIASWILNTGQSAIIRDVKKDSRFYGTMDKIGKFKTKSIIGVPLKSFKQAIGVIELINKIDERPFTAADLKILSIIADFAAIAIEKIYYYNTLKKIATIDALTSVANRRKLETYLYQEIENVKRYRHNISLLLIDIDKFKNINDRHGHLVGDKVLQHLAKILKKNTRKVDLVGRYGGDEFIVVMPHSLKDAAEFLKKRINIDIANHNKKANKSKYTVSIGLHSAGHLDIDDLLKNTDLSMYKEKENKREKYIKDIEGELQEIIAN